ncbi:oligosaccharide flippase family protein [Bacillus lacus]|uniref:Oligosaccharide flippase family protein n=1 Tax=Metabacillus lacus TaxID=1983721 RepID=A0A7X2J032_9BACI|nr:polysaccharide biosynthesis protein [Metabacillus lacus]MRX72961.1 oligosaccharide flippase family protein [Metabacillus lacus]
MCSQTAKKRSLVWQGAFVLTLAGLITKVLSAAYRVPYQNIVGDIGFYIYQQVYPFYGIAIMLATSGFPVIVSKLIAEHGQEENRVNMAKIMKICWLYFGSIGLFFFVCLNIGASYIADFMGDSQLAPLIRVVSFSFLLLPFISMLRGYFQGIHNMMPTAVSQVTEQSIRVITIIFLSYLMLSLGYDLYQAGSGALIGSLTGGVAAAGVLLVYWVRNRRIQDDLQGQATVGGRQILKELFIYSFTICLSSLLLILFQLVDAMNLYSLLVSNGMEETAAKQLKGVYDRGQPLIQLGTVAATSISLSLVPLISTAKKRNDHKWLEDKINLALKACLVVGAGATVGLLAIVKQTNIMLFRNELGSDILAILSVSILFTSLAVTIAAVLQGLNQTIYPALAVLAGAIVKIVLNILLIPAYQTTGAAVSSVAAFAVVAVLNIVFLRKQQFRFKDYRGLSKIILSAGILYGALQLYIIVFDMITGEFSRTLTTIEALSAVCVGGIVYVAAVLKTNVFTREELDVVPMGSRLKSLGKG